MKRIIVLLLLLVPVVALAQAPDSTGRTPTTITLTGEAKVYYTTERNVNLMYVSGRRYGPIGPYAYVQAGEDRSEFFLGPMWHWRHVAIGFGLGMGRIDSVVMSRANLIGRYDDGIFSAQVFSELSSGNWWLRSYAAVRAKPHVHLGWFYQRDVGTGPRMQFDLPEGRANVWICVTGDFQKEIFGFSYTF